jgi:hypothetical protein
LLLVLLLLVLLLLPVLLGQEAGRQVLEGAAAAASCLLPQRSALMCKPKAWHPSRRKAQQLQQTLPLRLPLLLAVCVPLLLQLL